MADSRSAAIADLLRTQNQEVLTDWLRLQQRDLASRNNLLLSGELEQQSREFLAVLLQAMATGNEDVNTSEIWAAVRDFLFNLSRSRAKQGFTPTETATFIFSLKQPVYGVLKKEISGDEFADALWSFTNLLDRLGLLTAEMYQKGREEIIARQQQELLELSTPVVRLWDGVLALPLIGTLDSARTQVVMESLLQAVVNTGSQIAIIDITGVPVVDTLVAQHLLKTVAAARLMGADCIISGIRPQIAQTIVHLGVEINDVITKATLEDAFRIALTRTGRKVVKIERGNKPAAAATEGE